MRSLLVGLTMLPSLAFAGITFDASAEVEVTIGQPPPIEATIDATVNVEVVAPPPTVGAAGASFDLVIDELVAPHWEASIGLAVATDLRSDAIHPTATIGRQVGPVRLSLDYAQFTHQLMCASTTRVGAAARYRISMAAGIGGIGAYVEAGLGREVSTFRDDSQMRTTSAMAGLGIEALFGGERSIGFDIGFRAYRDERDSFVGMLQLGMLVGSR